MQNWQNLVQSLTRSDDVTPAREPGRVMATVDCSPHVPCASRTNEPGLEELDEDDDLNTQHPKGSKGPGIIHSEMDLKDKPKWRWRPCWRMGSSHWTKDLGLKGLWSWCPSCYQIWRLGEVDWLRSPKLRQVFFSNTNRLIDSFRIEMTRLKHKLPAMIDLQELWLITSSLKTLSLFVCQLVPILGTKKRKTSPKNRSSMQSDGKRTWCYVFFSQ